MRRFKFAFLMTFIACSNVCMCCQVFFCIVIAAFALGTAGPNLEKIGTARGAAYIIWDIIDRV